MRFPPNHPVRVMGSMRLPWRRNRQRGQIACGWRLLLASRRAGRREYQRRARRCSGDVAAVESSRTALGDDLVILPCPLAGPIPLPRGCGYCAFAFARRCSGTTSDRAMRRRCRARRTRTPTRTERGVRTTRGCPTAPRRDGRIRTRCRPKSCCCDDGAKCRGTFNLTPTSSPATDRSWPSASASVAFSTSTTRLSTSWRMVRRKFVAITHFAIINTMLLEWKAYFFL